MKQRKSKFSNSQLRQLVRPMFVSTSINGKNKFECKDFTDRGERALEQDLEALGFWDCKCGYRNIIPQDTMIIKCSKCGKLRKFNIIDRNK